MGKHEPMSAKAIANKIKAKGLQKIKHYCQMCEKQCRDANGFKCHIESEAHHRQARLVAENPDRYVNEYSQMFHENFMHIFRTRYRHEKILANTIFQEYIKDRDHCHLNATRWLTLTDYANWLAEKRLAKVDESERGVLITYIDNDPKTLQRQELDKQRETKALEAAERADKEIKAQMEHSKKNIDKQREIKVPEPIAFEPICSGVKKRTCDQDNDGESRDDFINEEVTDEHEKEKEGDSLTETESVPVFNIQPFSLKPHSADSFKYKPYHARKKKKKLRLN